MSGGMVKVSLLAFARWDRPALHASSVGKVSVARGGPSGRICHEGQRVPRETSAQVTVSAWVHKTQARVRRAPVWGIGVSFYPRPCENRLIRHKKRHAFDVSRNAHLVEHQRRSQKSTTTMPVRITLRSMPHIHPVAGSRSSCSMVAP